MSRDYRYATTLGTLPFVGRDVEIRELLEAYQEAYSGGRVVAVVYGEMGSGKSRLLTELSRCDELRKAFVIRLRLGEPGGEGSIRALRQALLEAIESRPPLRRQVELLFASVDAESPHALVRALELIGHRVPLVIIVDDVDGTSPESVATLGRLIGKIESPLLFVCSANPSFRDSIISLCDAAETDPVELSLEPLTGEALADLVDRMLGFRPGGEEIAWLSSVTCGLPIMMRFAVHALMRQGCIALHEGRWAVLHPFKCCHYSPLDALPSLRFRLDELPQEERLAITTAALLGRRLPHALLERFGFGTAWYLPLVARDFLAMQGEYYVEFSHKLLYEAALAEALEKDLFTSIRATLLELFAGTLLTDLGVHLPPLTVRAFLASTAMEPRTRFDAMLGAVEGLYREEEYAAARGYFAELWRHWEELRELYTPVQMARWTNWYAQSLLRLGNVSEQRKLLEEFLAPFETEPPVGEIVVEVTDAMLELVECLYREKQIGPALDLLDRTRTLLLAEDRRQPRIQASFITVATHRAQLLVTSERYEEAAAIYRSILAQTARTEYSAAACQALEFLDDYAHDENISERIRTMLAICEREGRRRDAAQLRAHIVSACFAEGDYDRAEPILRSLIKEARQFHLPRTESNGWYLLAMIQGERGDFVEALRLMERSIEIRWRTRSIAGWQGAMVDKGRFLTLLGRHDEALAVFAQIERDAAENGRTYRMFAVELCRRMIAVRRGSWRAEQAGMDALRAIGEAERFNSVDQSMLELEAEILLQMPRVRLASAVEFARSVERYNPRGLFGAMLWVRAAAVLGRAVGAGAGMKTVAQTNPAFGMVIARTREVLGTWEAKGAMHNVAHAIKLLRIHASALFDEQELAERLASGAVPPSFHECSVIGFGRLRVVDLSGLERGGRHFGTHKSDSKPRKMLAALVAAAVQSRRLARERLVDMIWGENVAGDTAANNFHVTLSGLRQVIGDNVDFDGTMYSLNLQGVQVDAVDFLRMIAEAADHERAGRMFRAFDLLNVACGLYAGEFLEGIFDEWSDGPRDLLRSKARSAHLRLAEIAVQRGEFDVARQTVQRLLDLDSADEEAVYLHLMILQAEGERVRALREYDRFAGLLQEEYGVKPSRRLRDLREAIVGD